MKLLDAIPVYQTRINAVLNNCLPPLETFPTILHQAMRYSVLGGGKRIRALCVYFTGEALGAPAKLLDDAAAAIELVHAYSLIHDDLPAMDDDDLRHGKPSCHKAYGEANAILAGDALQSLAFAVLAKTKNSDSQTISQRLAMIETLAIAIGPLGMAGGQVADLEAEGKQLDIAQIEQIYRLKTGALISASIQLGAIAAACKTSDLQALQEFARYIGLAFQIHDDVIDIESATEVLGKPQGADIARNKATYPAIVGIEAAKEKVLQNYQRGIECLQHINADFEMLCGLAKYIVQRNY